MVTSAIDLTSLRSKILSRVTTAAQAGDVAGVVRWSDAAQACDALARDETRLRGRIQAFLASLEEPAASDTEQPSNMQPIQRRTPAKREGAIVRAQWVEKVTRSGVRLRGHGKRYATGEGRSVAVGFANELPGLPNKWFLGTVDEPTDVVVLLCRDSRNQLHDIVIPISDLGGRWKLLARSNGQIKFNVRKDVDEFLLLIPRAEPFVVSAYVGRYEPLNDQQAR